MLIVVGLGWRKSKNGVTASTNPGSTETATANASSGPALPEVPAPSSEAATAHLRADNSGTRSPHDRSTTKDVVRPAAEIQPVIPKSGQPIPSKEVAATASRAAAPETRGTETQSPVANDEPPSVPVSLPDTPQGLTAIGTDSAALPQFGAAVSQGVTEARLVRKVDPVYPQEARLRRLAGDVTLDATIAKDGSVQDVKLLSGSSVLGAAAMTAVRQWHYNAATLNGQPIEVHKRITMVFNLP